EHAVLVLTTRTHHRSVQHPVTDSLELSVVHHEHASQPTGTELFDTPDEHLRGRSSLKWATVDPDVLPAWVAEMDVHLAPAIFQTLQNALFRDDAGYPSTSDGLCAAFTSFASDRWNWHIDPEHISIHIDAATAASKLMRYYAGNHGQVMRSEEHTSELQSRFDLVCR